MKKFNKDYDSTLFIGILWVYQTAINFTQKGLLEVIFIKRRHVTWNRI